MSVKVVSDVQKIDNNIQDVYVFLSNFNKMGSLFEMSKQMAMEQMSEITEKIEDVRTTEDTCTLKIKNIGDFTIKIVEREEPKLIKLEDDKNLPINFEMWIQLLENGPYDTRMKITLEAEMNMMMKMMLKGKLEKGINQFAEGLAKIPYGFLK